MSRYRFILEEKAIWSVRLMCRVLDVSRSAFYGWLCSKSSLRAADDMTLTVHIKAIHRKSRGTYGSPRVVRELREEGFYVGRRRVARLMQENSVTGIPKRRFKGSTTESDPSHPVAPNLLNREFCTDRPNAVWVGDITYLGTEAGWVYLAVLIDLFSRKVVGWALEEHMRTELCLEALNCAAVVRQPAADWVHHTDRGSQYTSGAYRTTLEALGAVASMSRKGNCWDNAVSESFFGTLKQEMAEQMEEWKDAAEARAAVSDYIHHFYNPVRRHSHNGYQSPVDFENAATSLAMAA